METRHALQVPTNRCGLILAGSITSAAAKSDTTFLTEAIQINLAEISVGDLAQKNGGSDDVKSFGKMLVDDHTASNTKATSLAQANGVTPPTEPKPDDKKKHDELAKLNGAAFDKAYVANEVAYHKTVNGALESTLIPSANNGELKSLLQTGLKIFQGHQQHAEHVAADLK